MEDFRLERVWRSRLIGLGWSDRSATQYLFHLSDSTINQYNRYIINYAKFCASRGVQFPCDNSSVIADYLCSLCDTSRRPKSLLTGTVAALNKFFRGLGCTSIDTYVNDLVQALIKSGTKAPMIKTPAMPIQPFFDLFMKWPDNDSLSIKDLRLKCVCLMALIFMARPSDLAPRAVVFDPATGQGERTVLSANDVVFTDDGMRIQFHGIKNDYSRDGYCVSIPKLESGRSRMCLKSVYQTHQ